MYVTSSSRQHFLAVVRGGKEVPRVSPLYTVASNEKAPAILLHYEIETKTFSEWIRFEYDEVVRLKIDGPRLTAELAGTVLDELRQDDLPYALANET